MYSTYTFEVRDKTDTKDLIKSEYTAFWGGGKKPYVGHNEGSGNRSLVRYNITEYEVWKVN